MARVFTITPGLENMGAMKTGGQGSVYKGRRIGEIITAIKILPTPICSETADDRNFTAFQNEVAKLKKVNEKPNPNVVKILSSGISDTGNFPFIEMEFIEGPDLEELLQPPSDPIFTLKEVLKVAEQLSNALAHCHALDVRHGDIKSNNVKFNTKTGNYVLLDFGLAIMSDEQRRSSLNQAGAIEFMAPEQNTGQMLFETDVYSFGVILFELLAGTVPFPLKDKTENARNEVRLAHMVTPVPDVIELRRKTLPEWWTGQRKENEMQVPEWLVSMIYKCLEKKPEDRFANGLQLHDYIIQKFISRPDSNPEISQVTNLEMAKQSLVVNEEQLKNQLAEFKAELAKKESELVLLKERLSVAANSYQAAATTEIDASSDNRVSTAAFAGLLIFALIFAGFVVYSYTRNNVTANSQTFQTIGSNTDTAANTTSDSRTPTGEPVPSGNINSLPKQTKPVLGKKEETTTDATADSTDIPADDQNDQQVDDKQKQNENSLPDNSGQQTEQKSEDTAKHSKPLEKNANDSQNNQKSNDKPDNNN
jgi:serine/threonine-protein kinase